MIYLRTWMCHFVAMTLAWYITISCILFIFSVKAHDYVLDIDVPALFLILKLINGLYLKLLRNSVSVGVAWLLGKVILKVHFQCVLLEHAGWLLGTVAYGVVSSVV